MPADDISCYTCLLRMQQPTERWMKFCCWRRLKQLILWQEAAQNVQGWHLFILSILRLWRMQQPTWAWQKTCHRRIRSCWNRINVAKNDQLNTTMKVICDPTCRFCIATSESTEISCRSPFGIATSLLIHCWLSCSGSGMYLLWIRNAIFSD